MLIHYVGKNKNDSSHANYGSSTHGHSSVLPWFPVEVLNLLERVPMHLEYIMQKNLTNKHDDETGLHTYTTIKAQIVQLHSGL